MSQEIGDVHDTEFVKSLGYKKLRECGCVSSETGEKFERAKYFSEKT